MAPRHVEAMGSNGDVLAEDDVPHLPCDACLEDGEWAGGWWLVYYG